MPNRRLSSIAETGPEEVAWFSVPLQREDAPDEARDLVGLERLVEVADRAPTDALDLGEAVPERGHQDRPQAGSGPPGRIDQLDAVRARHPVVGQEEVDALAGEVLHRLGGARRGENSVPDDVEEFGEVLAHAFVVVDNQDGAGDRLPLGW